MIWIDVKKVIAYAAANQNYFGPLFGPKQPGRFVDGLGGLGRTVRSRGAVLFQIRNSTGVASVAGLGAVLEVERLANFKKVI